MTSRRAKTLDSGLTRAILALALRAIRCANVRARSRARSRRNDEREQSENRIPAFAGMTSEKAGRDESRPYSFVRNSEPNVR